MQLPRDLMPASDKQPSNDFIPWLTETSQSAHKGVRSLDNDPTATGWIEPTLLNSFVAPAAPMTRVRYRLHRRTNSLEFAGHIDATAATINTVAFILIQPYWPDYDISFLTDIYNGAAFGVSRCFINSVNGEVKLSWPAV